MAYSPPVDFTYDVAVLGAGVSGTAAALAAAPSARVCVIAAAPGATALFSGAWRGDCPEPLRDALRRAGYHLHECDAALPHPGGHLAPARLATAAHRGARLEDDALVCGFAGLAGFDAAQLALAWGARTGQHLGSHEIVLEETPAAGWSTSGLAAHLGARAESFGERLRRLAAEQRTHRLILPAVLGAGWNDDVYHAVRDAAGCAVGEALGAPPSLPGWRLQQALFAVLAAAGVEQRSGRVVGRTLGQNAVQAVTLDSGDVVRARRFVLATGKYAGGGIAANGEFAETALDCPVWIDHLGEIFESPDPLILTDPVRGQEQPLLRAGVHVNQEQQPVNRMDDVVYHNVFVAGSIRAGFESAALAIGDAAHDGWSAGLRAVRS